MSYSDIVEAIKQTPISDIVGRYVSLQKRGANSMGVCPFHNDSRPSMSVSDSKNIFKCFACGAAGDAITFVQKFKEFILIA